MNLPPVKAIFASTVAIALLAMVPLFEKSYWETSPEPVSPQIEAQWVSVLDLQQAAPQEDPPQLAVTKSERAEYAEPAHVTITSLPPIDADSDATDEIELVGSPQFIKRVNHLSSVGDSSRNTLPTTPPRETVHQILEPASTEMQASWETKLSKVESSSGNIPTEPKPLIRFDDDRKTNDVDSILQADDTTVEEDNDLGIEDIRDETNDEPTVRQKHQSAFIDDTDESLADQSADQTEMIFEHVRNSRVTAAEYEIRWSLNDAIMAALVYSNRVTSLRIESIEEIQNVGVESGQFDVVGFVDQSFRNSSEPVGTTIDTASGMQAVVQEEDLNIAYGLRKQLLSGGEVELNQSYQVRDNDSGILNPDDQAFSRVNARVTKELLRGAGRSIALNEVLVAHHDASAQRAESVSEIANHLNDVMTAYWDIVAARGALFASMENRQLAIEVLKELKSRREIDAERNLLDQAKATLRQRELLINDAHNDLIQAQTQLVSLVNAPELRANRNSIEILPQFEPDLQTHQLDVDSRINTAIQRRPEIADAIEQIKSAQVVDHVSLNDLLPRLSASIEAGLNGLAGDRQVGQAIENQFDNDVTYQVGFNFEVPFSNRQARYNKRRTELAVQRLRADWQNVIEQIKADVINNAQQFSASQTRLEKQRDILHFSGNELRYLRIRKKIAPKEDSNPSFALTQVLAAQDRQGDAKAQFIAAIADKHRALFELNRATGILINSDVIPEEGEPARPGLFSVYHHYIEDRPEFACDASVLESATRAQAKQALHVRRQQRRSGVKQLVTPNWGWDSSTEMPIESTEFSHSHSLDLWEQHTSTENFGRVEAPANWNMPAAEVPAIVESIRYPLDASGD